MLGKGLDQLFQLLSFRLLQLWLHHTYILIQLVEQSMFIQQTQSNIRGEEDKVHFLDFEVGKYTD